MSSTLTLDEGMALLREGRPVFGNQRWLAALEMFQLRPHLDLNRAYIADLLADIKDGTLPRGTAISETGHYIDELEAFLKADLGNLTLTEVRYWAHLFEEESEDD